MLCKAFRDVDRHALLIEIDQSQRRLAAGQLAPPLPVQGEVAVFGCRGESVWRNQLSDELPCK